MIFAKTLKRFDTVLRDAIPRMLNITRALSALRRPRAGMHHCRHGGRKTVAANPFHPINTQKCKRFAIENDYGKLLLPSRSKIIGRPSAGRNFAFSRSNFPNVYDRSVYQAYRFPASNRGERGRRGKYSTNSVIFSSRDWFRDWLLYKFVRDIAIDQFIRGKSRISLNVAKIRKGVRWKKLEHDTATQYLITNFSFSFVSFYFTRSTTVLACSVSTIIHCIKSYTHRTRKRFL